MTVYKLNDKKFRIYLTYAEIKLGFGGRHNLINMDKLVKYKLNSLICNTLKDKKITNGKIYLLKNKGCIITIFTNCNYEKYLFEFKKSEDLIKTIIFIFKEHKNVKSDLYLLDKKYNLIIKDSKPPVLKNYKTNKILISKTEEYGKPLILNNAIYRFGKAFINNF